MEKVRPHSRGTRQFLTFTGPWGHKIHPVIRSESCTFLSTRFPKLVSVDQASAYHKVSR